MRTLRTQRLQLRPICASDLDALHELWTEREVRRYLWDDKIVSRDTVSGIIATSGAYFDECRLGFFAVSLADEGERLIGFCGFRRFEGGEQVELLYGIHPRYWGAGLGTEAAAEALRYAFEECALEHVVAATDTPNQRSVRVLQRLGMVFESRREYHGLDTVFYSCTPADFAERR
ncbi:MAG: GNAT family N-acetyltransferase [Pseudomonadales bacterium]